MSLQFAIIGPELDIMCLKGKWEKQKKRILMFLNTYFMAGTWPFPSFNHPSHLGNIVGLIFTEETIGFEFNDLLKTTQLETFRLEEVAFFLSLNTSSSVGFLFSLLCMFYPTVLCPTPFLFTHPP